MGIVFPNEALARRWDGALQARLRRALLETFLRVRSIVPAAAGVAQDSDNLGRAAVSIVEAGLSLYFTTRVDDLAVPQQAVIGYVACLVSRSLAAPILQPKAWRIAALASTAQLLSPWIGLDSAALASAACARHFQNGLMKAASLLDIRIGECACALVNRGGADTKAKVSALIAASLTL